MNKHICTHTHMHTHTHACMHTHACTHTRTYMHTQSGKLVQKMFHKIQELIDDPDALVCVLIDEVQTYNAQNNNFMYLAHIVKNTLRLRVSQLHASQS